MYNIHDIYSLGNVSISNSVNNRIIYIDLGINRRDVIHKIIVEVQIKHDNYARLRR